jgi:hypothetical protein
MTCRSPANAQSIELLDFRTRKSRKYAPTPKTRVSVGSEGGSGSQRRLMRIETRGAIVLWMVGGGSREARREMKKRRRNSRWERELLLRFFEERELAAYQTYQLPMRQKSSIFDW